MLAWYPKNLLPTLTTHRTHGVAERRFGLRIPRRRRRLGRLGLAGPRQHQAREAEEPRPARGRTRHALPRPVPNRREALVRPRLLDGALDAPAAREPPHDLLGSQRRVRAVEGFVPMGAGRIVNEHSSHGPPSAAVLGLEPVHFAPDQFDATRAPTPRIDGEALALRRLAHVAGHGPVAALDGWAVRDA